MLDSTPARRLDATDTAGDAERATSGRLHDAMNAASRRLATLRHRALLGTIFAALADRMRNPLASVLAAAEMLATDCARRGCKARYADLIRHEAEQVDRIVATLQTLVHIDSLVPERVDAAALLRQTLAKHAEELHPLKVTIQPAPEPGVFNVIGHRSAVGMVFLEILSNAREAMPAGGRVRVELAASDGQIVMRFQDHGPGIAAEDLEQVFEPLYTNRAGALGLGLTVCKAVMEHLGGAIHAANMPEGGACFSLHLRQAAPTPAVACHV